MRQTSRQRTLRRIHNACASAAAISPMNSTCLRMSRQMPTAARPISSTTGGRFGSGSRSCSSRAGSNCLNRTSCAGSRFATSTGAARGARPGRSAARCRRHRSSRPARVDGHRTRRRVGQRAVRVVPQRADRAASSRPDSARTRRPSGVSLIASAAIVGGAGYRSVRRCGPKCGPGRLPARMVRRSSCTTRVCPVSSFTVTSQRGFS